MNIEDLQLINDKWFFGSSIMKIKSRQFVVKFDIWYKMNSHEFQVKDRAVILLVAGTSLYKLIQALL